MPLKAIIPALSQTLGMPLQVAKEVEWEVLYIRVKDVKPDDFLQRIAKVSFGRWENQNGIRVLKRDQSILQKMAADERKTKLDNLAKGIKDILSPKAAGNTNPNSERIDDGGGRAIALMAQQIGLNTIAAIPEGKRLVFSTSPTSMQRPLPSVDSGLIQNLILQHNKQIERDNAQSSAEGKSEEETKMEAALPPEMLKMGKAMEEAMKPKRIEGLPAKLDLIFEGSYSISASLVMYDAKGHALATFQSNFEQYDSGDEEIPAPTKGGSEGKTDPKPTPQPEDKSPVIKVSKESQQVFALSRYSEEEGYNPRKAMKGPIVDRVKKFAEKDPFLEADNEVLAGYANNMEGNLVLKIEEGFLGDHGDAQLSVNDISDELGVKKADGWALGQPEEPGFAADRALMASAIARMVKSPKMSIDDRAWFALNDETLGGDEGELFGMVCRALGVMPYGWRNQPLLKFYGTLDNGQKRSALGGRPIAVSALSSGQRAILESICFDSGGYVKPGGSEDQFDEENWFSMDFQKMMEAEIARMAGQQDYLNEPTESMPTGLLGSALVTLQLKNDAVLMPVSKTMSAMDYIGDMGGVTMDTLAAMMAAAEMMKNQPEVMGQMPTEVKSGTRETLTIKLQPNDKVAYSETHRDIHEAADGKTTKIADLGDEFQKLLVKRREDMKKWKPFMDMGMGMGMGRRVNTPPPLR